jgi:FRG domain
MVRLGRVESLDQYVKAVSATVRKWQKMWDRRTESAWLPWFRGEENADWSTALKPKLYRTKHKLKDVLRQEQDLRLEFKRCGAQLVGESKPSDHWERYFLMEHYGVPTRLLDWSDGALVALYFALKSVKGSHDAAVYILDPWWLNKLVYRELPIAKADRPKGSAMPDWDEAKPYLSEDEFENEYIGPKFPLAIDPSHVARRFAAQRSRFTIFGRSVDGLMKMCNRVPESECRLCRIQIKRAAVATMRRDLATCGISESTIFPDLEGFGRELSAVFQELWVDTNPG